MKNEKIQCIIIAIIFLAISCGLFEAFLNWILKGFGIE